MPPEAASDCPLLQLPPELKNRIYELVLTAQPHGAGYVTLTDYRSPIGSGTHSALSILATCIQINNEAASMFYSLNHIRISCRNSATLANLKAFVSSLPRKPREAMHDLACCIDDHPARASSIILQMLQVLQLRCTRLETLRLELYIYEEGDWRTFYNDLCARSRVIKELLSKFPYLRKLELVSKAGHKVWEALHPSGLAVMLKSSDFELNRERV